MSRHDRSRTVVRVLGGTAALVALPWMFTPPATASPCYGDCKPGVVRTGSSVLRYDAPVGVDDQITVTAGTGFFTVTDTTATFSAGAGCTMVSAHEAQCASSGLAYLRVRGLDGNDAVTNTTGLSGNLLGGTGNDRLTGGPADDALVGEFGADVLQGGGGSDTASYSDAATRTGVRADLDGATGDDGGTEDGPVGARDTIGTDVENLEGTLHDDVLIGNAGANTLAGGSGGHDQLQGLGGADQVTGRGGGTVDGGAGTDHCTSDLRGLLEQADTFVGCEMTEILN